jgi:ubiquinone/menaquinone biosynthesis C-methylase UbiE
MKRVPEPELMTDAQQAAAYAAADFSEPHQVFVAHFRRRFPAFRAGRVLDLGRGPADVTIRFARAYPEARLVGVDGAEPMLRLGREAVARAGLDHRVALMRMRLPEAGLAGAGYDAILSNSLFHHLADPQTLWQTVARAARVGAPVRVMGLARPASAEQAAILVERHAAGALPVLQRDFHQSLFAAYRPREVEAQLRAAGLAHFRIAVVSDRHWLAWGHVRESGY